MLTITTVNTTTLARRFGVTTKALEKRLLKLGIKPAQEMTQPSGKRFVLWPSQESIDALEKYKADRIEGRIERQPRSTQVSTTATEELQKEVHELKAMMSEMLEEMKRRP